MKPIRVFWSPLSQRFYATRAYKQIKPGVVEVTGEQFDVTNDIASQVLRHGITFSAPYAENTDDHVEQVEMALMDGPR